MANDIKHEKAEVTVIEVKPRTEITFKKDGKTTPKLLFRGLEGEHSWLFSTLDTTLMETIEASKDKVLVCDFTEHEWQGNDGPMTDRKVTQVYVDGKPIAKEKKGGGGGFRGGGGYGQESPEKMASIEGQSAFQGIVDLLVGKVIQPTDTVAISALAWASKKLAAAPTPVAQPAPAAKALVAKAPAAKTPAPAKAPVAPVTPPDQKQAEKDAAALWPEDQKPGVDASRVADIKAYIQEKQGYSSIQTVDNWIVSTCKISMEDFNADPEGKFKEISALAGW